MFRVSRLLVVGIALLVARGQAYGVAESEPNGTAATADVVGASFGTGAISPIGDVDVWRTTGASIFDLVFAYVDTTGSTDTDSSLDVTTSIISSVTR